MTGRSTAGIFAGYIVLALTAGSFLLTAAGCTQVKDRVAQEEPASIQKTSSSGNSLAEEPAAIQKTSSSENSPAEEPASIQNTSSSGNGPAEKSGNNDVYYFYSVLGEPERKLYNAMLEVAEHPNEEGFERTVVLPQEEYNREKDPFLKAYLRFALYCDHPELYWLSEIRTVVLMMEERTDEKGGTSFTFRLSGNYDNYEIETARLEQAADEFLWNTGITADRNAAGSSDIAPTPDCMEADPAEADYETASKSTEDASAAAVTADAELKDSGTLLTDAEIARKIHDGLMDLITYDQEAFKNPVLNENGKRILSYESSAYGALVEGRNGPHLATCGGYARAYQYLLQKCGIPSALVFGYVGYTEEVPSYHVWNMVCLDGEWYETDPTFDDAAFADDFFDKVVRDEVYDSTMENVYHLFYNVTSEEMKVRDGAGTCSFLLNDGKMRNVQGVVYHKRDTDYPENRQDLEYWTDSRLPKARGTKYAYIPN